MCESVLVSMRYAYVLLEYFFFFSILCKAAYEVYVRANLASHIFFFRVLSSVVLRCAAFFLLVLPLSFKKLL